MNRIHCIKCQKRTGGGQVGLGRTRHNRMALAQRCSECGTKKVRFISNKDIQDHQNGEGILSSLLGTKIPILSQIPLLGDILF
jgi:NAD-dependent SIR2 family protein deacetylase